jgi:hypothetical protein
MKKIAVSLLLLGALVLPVVAMGIPAPGEGAVGSIDSFYDIIGRAAWIVFAIIALIMFIVAGIKFLTAGGDPAKVGEARMAFIWGVAGVVVAVIAFSIVGIVQNLIG